MKLKDFMAALQAIESDRMLSKEIVIAALQEALSKAFRKHIENPDALVLVDINEKTGEIKVYQQRKIVEEVDDDDIEISLEDAKAINKDYELDGFVNYEIEIASLGRAAVILAKNVMKQKIREAEKQVVYDEYCDKVEEMVIGQIESVEEKFCVVNIGKTLALMPKNAQIPGERYHEGQRLRVVITEVNRETKGAQVLVSRGDANLVKRLFEKEVPEIYQGIIEVKAIARDAGERCKMAVYSKNENVDPIGACIGPRGSRVQVVIEELGGEKIDIFEWSEDVSELIKNALAPAEILAVIPSGERRGLMVIVNDNQLSLAIGKKGKNARLAVKLTGSKIDIKSVSDVEAIGMDWKNIAMQQKEETLRVQQEAKAKAQKEIFDENHDEAVVVDEKVFEEMMPSTPIAEEISEEVEKVEAINETEKVAEVEEIDEPVKKVKAKKAEKAKVSEEESDLERASRIAKEKKKLTGINIEEKREFVSKLEQFAEKTNKVDEKPARPKYRKFEEKKEEEHRKPTYDLSKKDYDYKPIYSEDELAEIARQEEEEKQKDWINDEIDFDEFDEFYEES
ncbi:MAG: transcription termination factor NusA [Erysipelotrichaceae bacterium]